MSGKNLKWILILHLWSIKKILMINTVKLKPFYIEQNLNISMIFLKRHIWRRNLMSVLKLKQLIPIFFLICQISLLYREQVESENLL